MNGFLIFLLTVEGWMPVLVRLEAEAMTVVLAGG